ncbi:Zinc finger C2H2 [Penicillium angulare]|uniref:Zinc finger C2H2 n=1 Tax=Penicillium angulare TaxID=116970 RepID=UPI002541BDB8|nr:Zinc finger C2H2 [Penicillium angulare]KAJ5279874.1 Zinc finger C2H2 [Penicillium angulare]
MASRDSPGSPLSSVGTAEDSDHETVKHESRAQSPSAPSNMPPSKRRRTGVASWDRNTPLSSVQDDAPPASPTASISSDSSGDAPASDFPAYLGTANQDDDYSGRTSDQVTMCLWDGCTAGDLGNMDGLVQHLHNEHIGSRQKRYSCEWIDCSRKGQTHASAYALRAHMRSHTREKPFYCTLPECDRNFTRSDALTKHMRSVHEVDSMRQADAKLNASGTTSVTGTPASKLQRIRLKLTHPQKDGADGDHPDHIISMNAAPLIDADTEDMMMPEYGPELGFDSHELATPPHDLYRLLRRQIFWAEKEGTQLRGEWDEVRPQRERAWREKEAIFEDLIDAELRLFSAILGDSDVTVPPATSLGSSDPLTGLQKLQQQQQQFARQQEQLRAKSAEAEDSTAVV